MNVPKLRFKGSFKCWKTDILGNYIYVDSGIALKGEEISENTNGRPILRGINITEGYIRHKVEIDRYYLGNLKKIIKYILEPNDIVLGMDGSKVGKNVAIIKESDAGSILIQRVARIKSEGKLNFNYLYQQIFNFRFHRYVDKVNTSSGIPHISLQQIRDFIIPVPESIEEQEKIASFFTVIDQKLNLLKEKKEKLELYKKGMMQQIFSQKLRFKDEKGNEFPEWEEKKLGDICEISKGKQLNVENMVENGLFPALNGGINYSGYTNSWNTEKETITISEGGNSCGFVSFINENFWCGGHCYALKEIKVDVKKKFLFQYLKYNELYIMRMRVGSGLPNIQKKGLNEFPIQIPHLKEQQKIANFLSALDSKINLVSTQIEKTELWKKGLLQQMFV